MNKYVLIGVLMAMFFSTLVFSQEPEKSRGRPQEEVGRQLRLRRAQMEMEGREAELDFQRKMRELELEQHKAKLGRQRKPHKHPACFRHCRKCVMLPFLVLGVCLVVHILLAVWVFQDIRKRNAGSGVWIVIALLTGLLGTLVYAVVRLGNTKQTAK
jgi:Flp pilus assembly protein TadB